MTQKQIDDLIHAPTRLRIMAALVELGPDSEITFPRLQTLLNMTPGNLSSHLKRLEGADYLAMSRSFTPRGVAKTTVRVTDTGIAAFAAYVASLKSIIGAPLEA